MNKKIGKTLERINFSKIISDILKIFYISSAFSIIYCLFSFEPNDINNKVITIDIIIQIVHKSFYIFLELKIFFEIFMSISLETYDGWIKNKNILYVEHATLRVPPVSYATSNKDIANYNHNIARVHEAGHATMAYIMKIKKFTVTTSYIKSCLSIDVEKLLYADDLKKHIYIDYSGAIAEELFLGNISTGCLGTDNADFEQAIKHIKQFIIMTEPKFSKTGLDEGINNRIVELSNKFYDEAKDILIENKEKIEKLAENLSINKTLTKNDIEKIFTNID